MRVYLVSTLCMCVCALTRVRSVLCSVAADVPTPPPTPINQNREQHPCSRPPLEPLSCVLHVAASGATAALDEHAIRFCADYLIV